jgi:hypothetical protein
MHTNMSVSCRQSMQLFEGLNMNFRYLSHSLLAVTLVAFVLSTVPAPARAGIISTADSIATPAALQRSADLAKIDALLARAEVQQQLSGFGLQPAQAQQRIAALSDAEVADLAHRIDQAPAGGDFGIIGLLGVVFIVLIVLDYIGAIHVFSHRR